MNRLSREPTAYTREGGTSPCHCRAGGHAAREQDASACNGVRFLRGRTCPEVHWEPSPNQNGIISLSGLPWRYQQGRFSAFRAMVGRDRRSGVERDARRRARPPWPPAGVVDAVRCDRSSFGRLRPMQEVRT